MKNTLRVGDKFLRKDDQIGDKAIGEALLRTQSEGGDAPKFLVYEPNPLKKKIIEVRKLQKSFDRGKNKVLRGINLDFYERENTALLGGNGAGKTTFVEIVAGISKPDAGEIRYNFPYKNSFQERIGIQFQDSTYPRGIAVKSVVEFARGIYKSELSDAEVSALVKIFGVDAFYKKKAASLSGGQSQRLNCLLAVIHRPTFLILDEMSTGLDVAAKSKIKAFIKSFCSEHGITVLLVSHDMDEIAHLAERVVVLSKGEVAVDARIEQVKERFGSLSACLDLYV